MLPKSTKKWSEMAKTLKRNFGAGGPYNPYRYKDYMAPRNYPKYFRIIINLKETKRSLIIREKSILCLSNQRET